ncbi:MAG: DedA family protein [Ktedonobacteraceae bacterium]|nr:DedA family protein [Chloroflexota bacterium]
MRWLSSMLRNWAFMWHSGPLASLISLQTLENALHVWGYPAVTLFIMIESSGIPFPGETMLLLASFLAANDPQLQIPIIIACAALGAIVGDNIGYTVGRKGGRPFVERFGRYVFLKPQHLDRADQFFAKHGNKTVFFGRFIAVLRAWAAFLAGVNHMHWRTFLVYNAAGGILWAIIYGCLGYFAGRFFHDNFAQVERIASNISWIGAGIIIIAVVIAFVVFRRRRARQAEHPTVSTTGENKAAQEPGSENTTQPHAALIETQEAPADVPAQPAGDEMQTAASNASNPIVEPGVIPHASE